MSSATEIGMAGVRVRHGKKLDSYRLKVDLDKARSVRAAGEASRSIVPGATRDTCPLCGGRARELLQTIYGFDYRKCGECTGVYVSNVWYLNFSDAPACRITGMTRFASFWVEGGRIAAPLEVMRFDETLYRAFGENLIGLTREREVILDAGTYGSRETGSGRIPGALIEDFNFNL